MRRRARVLIDERILRELLHIPADIRVLGTAFDPMSLCVVLHLEGERLPEVPDDEIAPCIWPQVHVEDRWTNDLEYEITTRVEWPIPDGDGLNASGMVKVRRDNGNH